MSHSTPLHGFSLALLLLAACDDDAPGPGNPQPADFGIDARSDAAQTTLEGSACDDCTRNLILQARIDGQQVAVSTDDERGIYAESCADLELERLGPHGWEAVDSELTIGDLYLDGVRTSGNEGCDIRGCGPFAVHPLTRREYAPEPELIERAPGSIPYYATRLADGELRVKLTYYLRDDCSDEPLITYANVAAATQPAPAPRATRIRVVNDSSEVRSLSSDCGGFVVVGVTTQSTRSTYWPTCQVASCDQVARDEVLPADSTCTGISCAGARVDLAPGETFVALDYDGTYAMPTSRNCSEALTPPDALTMTATLCYGVPGEDLFSLNNSQCKDTPFSYGADELTIHLD